MSTGSGYIFVLDEFSDSLLYISYKNQNDINLEMTNETYGVRSQLVNKDTLSFVDDFIYKIYDGNVHIINAVSPAFTSSFALAKYLSKYIK